MKKKFFGILTAVLTLGVLGGTAFAAAGDGLQRTDSAEAATTEIEYRFTNNYSWGKVFVYAWGSSGNNTWPGMELTDSYTNENNETVYKFSLPSKYTSIIFNENGGKQTHDITISSNKHTNKAWYISGESYGKFNVGTWTWYENDVFLYDPEEKYGSTPHIYTWDSNHDNKTYESWPGTEMVKYKGDIKTSDSLTIFKNDFIFKDNFNYIIFNGNNSQTVDLERTNDYGKCYNAFTDEWVTLNDIYALDFNNNLMQMENTDFEGKGTGVCQSGGYYSKAKEAYATYTNEIIEIIKTSYPESLERLSKWATYHDESFDATSGVFQSKTAFVASHNNMTTIVIICFTLLTLTSAFLIIKKKRSSKLN